MSSGLLKIQRLTEAEALIKLEPYKEDNRNSTAYMFLDIDDGYKLKGIFFDDSEPNEKIVKCLSCDGTGGVIGKEWLGQINQVGILSPTASIQGNTTGANLIFTRIGVGSYNIESDVPGLFSVGKTNIQYQNNQNVTDLGGNLVGFGGIFFTIVDISNISFKTYDFLSGGPISDSQILTCNLRIFIAN